MTVTNKEIAAGFAAAKKYLWDGVSPQIVMFHLPAPICTALARASDRRKITVKVRKRCKEIIAQRIDRLSTLESWLNSKGVKNAELTRQRMQAHRHAWLDLLIKEFSE